MPRRAGLALLAALLSLGLASAPAAHAAAAFDEVLKDYQADGKIDPCKHSDKVLRDAANQVPSDIAQYAPDFPDALGKAIDQRAQGKCAGKGGAAPPASTTPTTPGAGGGSTPTTTTPPATAAPPATTAPGTTAPAPAHGNPQGRRPTGYRPAGSDDGTPAYVYVLIAAGALLLLGALVFALGRWLGWDGRRTAGVRQACGEASFRAGGTWADFRDWLRVGR